MTKKREYTEEQLSNDPSLKFHPYAKWELVWSDEHQKQLRFVEYEGEFIRLATVNGIVELPGLFAQEKIRRNVPKRLDVV